MQNKTTKTAPAKDFCQTPAYALQPLWQYLPRDWAIWECAAGEGYLYNGFIMKGFKCAVCTDIIYDETEDFLTMDVPAYYDCIITNPPYSKKYKFIERCYELGKPFALLMPVETLGAATAQRMFRRHGMELICVSPRIDYKMPNKGWEGKGSHFPSAWFTHGLSIGQDITYYTLDKKVDNPAME